MYVDIPEPFLPLLANEDYIIFLIHILVYQQRDLPGIQALESRNEVFQNKVISNFGPERQSNLQLFFYYSLGELKYSCDLLSGYQLLRSQFKIQLFSNKF